MGEKMAKAKAHKIDHMIKNEEIVLLAYYSSVSMVKRQHLFPSMIMKMLGRKQLLGNI